MSSSRRFLALLAVLPSLMLVLAAGPASAHTDLVSATPGPGVTVNRAVGDLTLTFVSPLVTEGTRVLVKDPSGDNHAGVSTTLGSQARVPLEPLTRAGTYTVTYRAVAGDGHPITGGYEFRVSDKGAAAGRALEPAPAGADQGSGGVPESGAVAAGAAGSGSSSTGLLIGGLGAGTLAVLLLGGVRRRPQPEEVS